MKNELSEISYTELMDTLHSTKSVLLDVRHQNQFVKAHVPGSLFIGLEGPFVKWVQLLIENKQQAIILVTPVGKEQDAVTLFRDLGYTNVLGYLKGGFELWEQLNMDSGSIKSITAAAFKEVYLNQKPTIFDVRKESEYEKERIEEVNLLPLEITTSFLKKIPSDKTSYLYCGGGYRSVIAASFLKANGIHNLINIVEGFGGIKRAGFSIIATNL